MSWISTFGRRTEEQIEVVDVADKVEDVVDSRIEHQEMNWAAMRRDTMLLLPLWWTTLLQRPGMVVLELLEVALHSSGERSLRGVESNPRVGDFVGLLLYHSSKQISLAKAVQ
jgi:hypothetical protein